MRTRRSASANITVNKNAVPNDPRPPIGHQRPAHRHAGRRPRAASRRREVEQVADLHRRGARCGRRRRRRRARAAAGARAVPALPGLRRRSPSEARDGRMHCPFCGHDGDQGDRLAPRRRGAADPPPPRVPEVRRALHDLRDRGAADAAWSSRAIAAASPSTRRKLRAGMEKALEKRPVAREQIDEAREPHRATRCAASASARSPRARSASWSWRSCAIWTRWPTCASPRCTAVRGRRGVSRGDPAPARCAQSAARVRRRRARKRAAARAANRDQLPLLPARPCGQRRRPGERQEMTRGSARRSAMFSDFDRLAMQRALTLAARGL